MKRLRAIPWNAGLVPAAVFFVLTAVLSGCRASDQSGEKRESGGLDEKIRGRIVLEITGTSYTNGDFDSFARTTIGQSPAALDASALSRLFDDFCDEKILLAQARASGAVLSDRELADYLEKFRDPAETAASSGAPPADPSVLSDRLLTEKYLSLLTKDLIVADGEVAAFYEAHKSDFLLPEKVQVSQILLDSEGKASTIRERLSGATEEDFRAVARRESAGPEAAKGGIMGDFSPGQLPQELESFILPLREGEISRVVGSTYGFHIFRLDKRSEARLVTLADASAGIRARLLDEKGRRAVADHLGELKRTQEWRAFPDRLPFAYQRNDQP